MREHCGNLHIAELAHANIIWKKQVLTLNHRYGDISPSTFNWLARVASTIARVWTRRRREQHVRLMSSELQGLDDRMLKDIGIQRCRIETAVLNGRLAEWYAPLAGAADTANNVARTQCDGKAQQQ
jgi:hypothetical protein